MNDKYDAQQLLANQQAAAQMNSKEFMKLFKKSDDSEDANRYVLQSEELKWRNAVIADLKYLQQRVRKIELIAIVAAGVAVATLIVSIALKGTL